MASPHDTPEITDLIVDYDPTTLARRPVRKREVAARFRELGRQRAARLVERLPDDDGVLDATFVDALMVRIHAELQRLHEEFQHGGKLMQVLGPVVKALLDERDGPIRVVDVGCGTGYLLRWLAAFGELDSRVELIGCDYNAALIAAARRAADEEDLRCRFEIGNAFELDEPAHLFISMGVIHHFRDADLERFFAAQATPQTRALIHYDIAPTWLTPIGAWIFHLARMREPIAVHDGVLSALRAHDDAALLAATKRPLADMSVGFYARPKGPLPLLRVMRPIVAVRPELRSAIDTGLGRRARAMEWQW